jgi:hypothetical protein
MSEQMEETASTGGKPGNAIAIAALVIALIGTGVGVYAFFKLNSLAEDEALAASLSRAVAGDRNLRRTIADSNEITAAARAELEAALEEEALLDELVARTLESDGLNRLVASGGAAAAASFAGSDAFRDAVRAVQGAGGVEEDPVAELRSSLSRYEKQLAELAREVEDDESAAAVNEMQGQLVSLRRDIAGLADQVACAVAVRDNSPRTFLLRSNESTALPGMDLVVSLSRLRDEAIETVSVSAREGSLNQVHTQVIGNVGLGKPFVIDQGATRYEGMFTFAQPRLFAKALVGFEIRMTSADAASCLEGEESGVELSERSS